MFNPEKYQKGFPITPEEAIELGIVPREDSGSPEMSGQGQDKEKAAFDPDKYPKGFPSTLEDAIELGIIVPDENPENTVTHEVMPFDELARYLEEGEKTSDQKLGAIRTALAELAKSADIDEVTEGLGDITGIALEHGFDPDLIEEIYHQEVAELPEEE